MLIKKGGVIIGTVTFAIINRGKGNIVLKKARELGARGGTILLAEGTVKAKTLSLFGANETHKEILIIYGDRDFSKRFHESLNHDFKFYGRNKGIAFTVPYITWTSTCSAHKNRESYRNIKASHACIVTVVDSGKSSDVMKAARRAGATGGTVVRGHGAGSPKDYYFPVIVEPEKEILLMVTTVDKVDPIRQSIIEALELQDVGAGIIYALPVVQTNGLFEQRLQERRGGQ